MFAKLLKHEIKSTGALLGVLSIAALAMGVIGGLLLRINMNIPVSMEAYELISTISVILLPFVIISLFGYAIGGEIYLAVQFYKRKFTDQGYLTFTLPVRSWQIYLSSLLNMMLWTLIIGLVTVVAIVLLLCIGIFDTDVWRIMMMETEINFSQDLLDIFLSEYVSWSILYPIISFVSANVLLITSITLGCVVAKKHKILASVGCYYLISMVINAASTIVSAVSEYDSVNLMLDQIYMSSSVLHLVTIVAGSALTIWLMDKKLNLP